MAIDWAGLVEKGTDTLGDLFNAGKTGVKSSYNSFASRDETNADGNPKDIGGSDTPESGGMVGKFLMSTGITGLVGFIVSMFWAKGNIKKAMISAGGIALATNGIYYFLKHRTKNEFNHNSGAEQQRIAKNDYTNQQQEPGDTLDFDGLG